MKFVGNVYSLYRNVYKETRYLFVMDRKKFLVIGLLSLFMISMFAGVVSAETMWEKITKGGGVEISEATKGTISKWLLVALVILLVYAIADVIPFLKGEGKEGIRWGVSIIVGVLSFMFVSTEYVMTILTTYEALGIALTSVIPLVILMAFMWRLRDERAAIARVIEKPLYILFTAYLVYRWLFTLEGNALQAIYLVTVIITLGWMVIEEKVWKKFKKEKKKEEKGKFEDVLEVAADVDKAKGKQFKSITEGQGDEFD